MLPWVFIDVGEESDRAARWVERACNRAIAEARCTTDPRAVLLPDVLARVLRSRGRGVRIEVDVAGDPTGAGLRTRELTFKPQDPPRERWRSVGLVVATLVGEIQQDLPGPLPGASSERATSPAPEVPSEPEPAEETPPPLTLAEALGSEPVAEPRSPEKAVALEEGPAASLPKRYWAGVGAALVPPRGDAGRQLGLVVEGHALWLQPLTLDLAVRYAEGGLSAPGAQQGDGIEALGERELVAHGGVGLQVQAASRAAIRVGVSLGARYQMFDSQLEGEDYQASGWLPDLRASLGVWLSLLGGAGIWVSADAATSLAASRALDGRTESVLARVPATQFALVAGVGWGR